MAFSIAFWIVLESVSDDFFDKPFSFPIHWKFDRYSPYGIVISVFHHPYSWAHCVQRMNVEIYTMSEPFWVKDDAGSYHITQPVSDTDIVVLASQILEESVITGESLEKPAEAAELFKTKLGLKEHEVFAVAWLNNHHRLICFEVLFTGTINSATVYPREVVKRGIALNAGAAIVGHNHPSGVTDPSRSDLGTTHFVIKTDSFKVIPDFRCVDIIISQKV